MRASDQAYATLLDEIQTGVLAPGTVLGEVEQSARLGVSRTPLRSALGRLASEGLVAQSSPRVTVVTDVQSADIRSLFTVRRALEETAARLAAASPLAPSFAGMAEAFASADLDGDAARDAYYSLIADFDAALDAAADNDYLVGALQNIRIHLVRVRRLARYRPERLAASVAEHRLIASAIAAGDGDLAAHAVHVHLHNALTSILDSLETSPALAPRAHSTGRKRTS
ncbi:GntR family transcriptional regulator [Microbacterium testaceum]|uniref:GntR family transcriptional regulator n=1 Tax=Microbacterium testaceum TaxID=2033 RepID=A0A147EUA7_MICTE|nr:GntR family transcriptional regulator [Microbacterium testaceum]KTR91582.1 GntR family transcriptional regulator [Microbacterium testaceum]